MTGGALGVVVVVYRTAVADSPAIRTLQESLRHRDDVYVVVQDNSEEPVGAGPVPDVVDVLVVRRDNPGLARAYSTAAELLSDRGVEWMMLLDQDTAITRTFLEEVLGITSGAVRVPDDVSILVPHLSDRGREVSPHGRVRLRTRPLTTEHGVVSGWSTQLNSGSVVRLAAVARAGGFPTSYPLDYLDHALAARLRQGGGRTWVLGARLEHRLSVLDRRTLSRDRLVSVLDAEQRYHCEFGSRADRMWFAARSWGGALLSAARLRPSPDPGVELAAAVRATRGALSRGSGTSGG